MIYTKEKFKELWEANEHGSDITFNDIIECAVAWGIFVDPRTRPLNEITYRVLKAAQVNDAEEHNPTPQLEKIVKENANLTSKPLVEPKKVWHRGVEKPEIYKDKLTGNILSTYALCVIWYDGWIEDICRVTEDHKFVSMTDGKIYNSDFFWYWCYTYDLMPCENTTKLINIGTAGE